MSEQSPKLSQEQIEQTIDKYVDESQYHTSGSIDGHMSDRGTEYRVRHRNVLANGYAYREDPTRGGSAKRGLEVKEVDGSGNFQTKHLARTEYGSIDQASTTDGKSRYNTTPWSTSVTRETPEGKYTHVFTKERAKKAGELIAGLATKRASRDIEQEAKRHKRVA